MEKSYFEFKGNKYPYVVIPSNKFDIYEESKEQGLEVDDEFIIADERFWNAIEESDGTETIEGGIMDDEVFFYVDASILDLSEDEIVKYVNEQLA